MVFGSMQALVDFKVCLDPWTQCLQAAMFAACGHSWAGLPPRSAFIFLVMQKIVMCTCFSEHLRGRCFSPAEGLFWAQILAMLSTAFYEGWTVGFARWRLQDIILIFLVTFGMMFLLLTAAFHWTLRKIAIVSHRWSPICSGLITLAFALVWALTGAGGWAAQSPQQTPMSWVVQFILLPGHARLLLLQWPLILLVGVGSIHFVAGRCDASACGDAAKLKVLYRKAFHALAIALFVPPILTCQVAFLGFSLLIAAILFVVVEVCRAYKVPGLAPNLDRFVSRYLDKREDTSKGDLVLTHLYLLLGCAIPVWLDGRLPGSDEVSCKAWAAVRLASGILLVGVGDAFAAAYGVNFGRTRWPLSHRTLEGSASFLASVLLAAWALWTMAARQEVGRLADHTPLACKQVAAIVCATFLSMLFEVYTSSIDNLVLPLYFCPVLRALGG